MINTKVTTNVCYHHLLRIYHRSSTIPHKKTTAHIKTVAKNSTDLQLPTFLPRRPAEARKSISFHSHQK